MSLLSLYVIWPIIGIRYENLDEYYFELGKIMRIWGYAVGIVFVGILVFLFLRGTIIGSLKSLSLRLTRIEQILALLFMANIGWTVLGLINGAPTSYLIGDTFKGMMIPGIYWVVKKSRANLADIVFLTRVVLWGETLLLFILVPTGHIPFSFAGRTFLTTVFFTLVFEENNTVKRIAYGLLVVFGIFALLTTAAVRGIIIIMLVVILLNYLLRLREIKFGIVVFAFMLPILLLYAANDIFDLQLGGYVQWAGQSFAGSLSRERRYFGLDESLAQRVGETIDVGRTFSQNSPIFFATGFGNGAHFVNYLITPAEFNTYKTNTKHHIYITPVAVMYRFGLLGVALYGGIVFYVVGILRRMRRFRALLAPHREFVYLKVLGLYQVSVLLMSVITYWYIGNLVVGFTLALMEFFRLEMESKIQLARVE